MFQRCFLFLFLLSLPFWLPSTYRRSIHPFRPSKCIIQWPLVPEWEATPPPDLHSILQQPFSYLSKGGQSLVFISHDGRYVLKLFHYDVCRMPLGRLFAAQMRKWMGLKPRHFLPAQEKIKRTFDACALAYRLAKEQTGLVFVHLNTKKGLPMLTVIDRLGRKHILNPERVRFALQKRAEPFLQAFIKRQVYCIDAPHLLRSFHTLLSELSLLGIANTDPRLEGNFGVLDGRVIAIDFGYFIYSPEEAKQKEKFFEEKLQRWLQKHY